MEIEKKLKQVYSKNRQRYQTAGAGEYMLHCVEVCYSVLQCDEGCCRVMQCVAVWNCVLQCVAVCCVVYDELIRMPLHCNECT